MSKGGVIYKGMTRQDIIDNLVQYRFDIIKLRYNTNAQDDLLYDILEYGHTGYSEYNDDKLIEEYQLWLDDDDDDDDDDDSE